MLVFLWILALLAAFMLPQAWQAWAGQEQVWFDFSLAQNVFTGLVVALAVAAALWARRRRHPWRPTGLPLFLVGFFGLASVFILAALSGLINIPPQGQVAAFAGLFAIAILIAFAVNACYDLEKRRLRTWLALWLARHHGRRDGAEGIPSARSTNGAKQLGVLKNRGEQAGSRIGGDFVQSDARIRREYREARHHYLELASDRKLLEAYADKGRLHKSNSTIQPAWYLVALVLLTVSEFPLNFLAFQAVGGETIERALITLSLAVTVLACAHGLGAGIHSPKERAERDNARPEYAPVDKKWIAVLILVPMVACGAVALIRLFYFEAAPDTVLVAKPALPLVAVAFFVVNILVFTAGTMLSWLYHNPFAENLRHRRAERSKMEQARAELKSNFQEHKVRYEGEKNYYQALYSAYAQENERARQGDSPYSFDQEDPPLDDPGPLDERGRLENEKTADEWDSELARWDAEVEAREIPEGARGAHKDASTDGEPARRTRVRRKSTAGTGSR